MNKLAQAILDDSVQDSVQELKSEAEELKLKKQKEDDIRFKLARFARELSRADKKRNQH
ncbi:MAG: hypothetical protein QGG67_15010 [Gammaproteobacteria bacterium]|jgi:hypothetical protein|nr:hypothetical protein [Gammaproteobacteria bacterium]|tara:strand:- start:1911 stop:2087 length:177 start_codon:yes stop_codon:yes gene_type:complete